MVCLPALSAVDEGQRKLYSLQIAAERGQGGTLQPVGQQLAVVQWVLRTV